MTGNAESSQERQSGAQHHRTTPPLAARPPPLNRPLDTPGGPFRGIGRSCPSEGFRCADWNPSHGPFALHGDAGTIRYNWSLR